jgi:5-dehydro-2-deoxygluconokinase
METVDVLSVGRISVDLYSMEPNVGFDGQQNFQKSVGGSPTNVAVAAAQLGLRVALATKVGDDAFGEYVKSRLAGWGVDTDFVGTVTGAQTPLAFAALTPPESPTVIFYRGPAAPDTTITTADVPADVVRNAKVLWISQASLAQGSTADTCLEWMSLRSRDDHTILDLDYRPSLWASVEDARSMAERAIALATVIVGNREECAIAVGTDEPDAAADALLAAGVRLAIIKLGADGVMLATATERISIPALPIDVVCGLGAGDAFGGSLCYGLLHEWDLDRIGRFASAAGALVSTRLTCADAMPTVDELDALMGEPA